MENKLSLKRIFLEVYSINEIGNTSTPPPGASYSISTGNGHVSFDFSGHKYIVDIRVPVQQGPKIALTLDFTTADKGDSMTNANRALTVMSYIVGSIETWLEKYKKKYFPGEPLSVVYIKYNPKSEESEDWGEAQSNKRDRLYRMYLEKFGRKHGTSTSFVTQGGIIAKFDPPLIIE